MRIMIKSVATSITGSLTQTTKMPCKSYSLPTVACVTGFKMAQIPGSICSSCYANKGNYTKYAASIEPAQHARLDSVIQACESADAAFKWVDAMVTLIGSDTLFRWHDSGDLQDIRHLHLIVLVARATPHCRHWLPTREYGMVKDWVQRFGELPENLIVRLSAMYVDKPVVIPSSLRNVANVASSNVHTTTVTAGSVACPAPRQNGACNDCRQCWNPSVNVSYQAH